MPSVLSQPNSSASPLLQPRQERPWLTVPLPPQVSPPPLAPAIEASQHLPSLTKTALSTSASHPSPQALPSTDAWEAVRQAHPDPPTPPEGAVLQHGLVSQACQAAIKGYHHFTRHTALANGYQERTGKCFYRTVSHAHLSDSDYGLVAYQWFNPAWATVLTAGRVMSCNPIVAQTPLFALFDKPLPPAAFMAKAKALSQGLAWFKLSESKQEVKDALHTLSSPIPKTKNASVPPPPFISDALFNFKGKAWTQGLRYVVNQPAHHYPLPTDKG